MFIVAIVLAVVFGLNFVFVAVAQYQTLNTAKENELTNIGNVITAVLQDRELIAAGAAEIISYQPWVAKNLRSGDREELLKHSQTLFGRLRSAYGVNILQFFTPPAQALLFVEDPAMPASDFRATRRMVIAANVQGVTQRGLELGPSGLAVRGIAPVKDNADVVGVVEYASDFQALLKQVSALTDAQVATFIDSKLWNQARKTAKEYTPERDQVIDGKRAAYSTDWDLTTAAVIPEVLAPTRGDRHTLRTINGTDYGVLTMPLVDFSGQQIGFIVCVRNFSVLSAAFVDALRFAAIRILLSFIITFGMVSIIFNSLLVRPVDSLLDKLKELISGRTDRLFTAEQRKEVDAVLEAAEQFRLKSPPAPNTTKPVARSS
jgi:methyl-accepting chemotaxis protein